MFLLQHQHPEEQVLVRLPQSGLSLPPKPHPGVRVLPLGKHGLLSGQLIYFSHFYPL